MNTISKEIKTELIEKKSRFITRLKIVSSQKQAEEFIHEITLSEKGAVHNCYAFRILKKNESIYERKSDDGEPGGTAGAPMLAVLNGNALVNTLALTTRYFGGIKLGTGGLVNVYKRGVNEALKSAGIAEYKIFHDYEISFPINETDHCVYLLKKEKIDVISKIFGAQVDFIIKVDKERADRLIDICKLIKGSYVLLTDKK